uniref:Uncharacterized protein n=1 Tax=Onchocerca volvulus TaxID=6282 RepID=A0A8R1XS93_ONCVO
MEENDIFESNSMKLLKQQIYDNKMNDEEALSDRKSVHFSNRLLLKYFC